LYFTLYILRKINLSHSSWRKVLPPIFEAYLQPTRRNPSVSQGRGDFSLPARSPALAGRRQVALNGPRLAGPYPRIAPITEGLPTEGNPSVMGDQ
jgi:hypothetical protein